VLQIDMLEVVSTRVSQFLETHIRLIKERKEVETAKQVDVLRKPKVKKTHIRTCARIQTHTEKHTHTHTHTLTHTHTHTQSPTLGT
jgi:ABC-type Zn2+ transport system substrate-binding protein/surface adhesin